ncbi:hypothetical protein [Paenibacillus sp. N3.4]|uniref:hypothetical protein n=1 Tax=Paenibacillus sp. N3.4 TaxID=2603222 RepID=UPI0011CC7456|nr:hypothetical protein [Paenibacillus sp. N3.4]TXK75436.1 hypothetical protein FU659_27505 [Paenibacillus sp. N3.4]
MKVTGKGTLSLIVLVTFLCLVGCSPEPHKRLEDATNKELQDFHKWEQKQDQKKWENEKPYKK